MTKKKDKARAAELRKRAEKILSEGPQSIRTLAPADIQKLIQEFNVYQIELELQNEELRRSQLELQEARDKYVNLYDFAPIGYFTLDHNCLIVDVNLAGSELLGSEKHRLIGTQFTSSISPDSQDAFYLHHRDLLKAGTRSSYGLTMLKADGTLLPVQLTSRDLLKAGIRSSCELKMLKADGTLLPVQLTSRAMTEKDGNINQFRTAVIDITKRKQMEEVLKESEERYRTTLDIMDESYYELDLAGNFTFVNDSICRLLGYSREELIGMNYRVYTVKEDISTMYNAFNKVYRTGEPQQRNIFHGVVSKDGKKGFRETSAFPKRNIKGEIIGFRGISVDITERKQVEEALRESEERYRFLVELSPDAIFVASEGRHVFINSAGVKLLGASSPDRIIGKPIMDIIHPDYHEIVAERIRKAMETGIAPPPLEEKFIRLDGTEIEVEVRAVPLVYQGKQAMQTVIRDITERKRIEEERSKLERMKTEFISNISHEFRTPLQSIMGFTKLMLQGRVPDPETQKEFLTIIDNQSEHLLSLIEDLLDISRVESGRFDINKAPTSLRDLIQSVVHGFHNTANAKNIALTEDIPAALPEIEADEGRLRQVMANLLGNAIKFSKDGGKITVKAEAEDSKVLVQVTDCGIGIPKEAMKHLFEKFYQGDSSITRTYGGSGLGLYISKQIIEAHGGSIWAESKPGKKTTLSFIIPRVSERGRKKLGELLIEDRLISEQDLAEALKKQESQK